MAKTSDKSSAKPTTAASSAPSRSSEQKQAGDAGSSAQLNRMPAVTPHLVCESAAKAIEFYKKAFGAKEVAKLEGPDGRVWHACVEILGAPVMLVDEFPEMGSLGPKARKGTSVTIHLNAPDADALADRAVAAGATLTMPVADAFWGDRYGQVEDPFGHRWSIATHVRDMTMEEIKAAMPSMSDCCDAERKDA